MIKGLRNLANWLEKVNCNLHYFWNSMLERLKVKCQCERLQK